jgi:universal stress protein E
MADEAEHKVRRVFAVIDPERMVQPAFERGEWVASRNGSILHLFCCLGEEGVAPDDPKATFAVKRAQQWLERLTRSSGEYEIDTEIQVEWNPYWRERIAPAARECGADMIIKTVSRHSGLTRAIKATSDWTLLREADCPVLLIDPIRPPQPRRVLAAVKLNPDSKEYTLLNDEVMAVSHRMAAALEAELHAVTVYRGDDMYFDRQKLADSCGLPRNRVHSVEGAPHRGIAQVAREIDADVLVIGSAHHNVREGGSIIGDTAQRIIDAVNTDLVVIPAA